jgi:hypothetical protein
MAINRDGRLNTTGLLRCHYHQIQPASTGEARRSCASALVGAGSLQANVALPDQSPFPSEGKMLAFNGRLRGRPAILAHIYGTRPAAHSYTLPFGSDTRRVSSASSSKPTCLESPANGARSQRCTAAELLSENDPGGGCPNGSQVELLRVAAYGLSAEFLEPLYMMAPPWRSPRPFWLDRRHLPVLHRCLPRRRARRPPPAL